MAQLSFEKHTIDIGGMVDFDCATSVYHDLCSGLDEMDPGDVVVNLAQLECADSSMLSCLVLSLKYAKSKGITLRFMACPGKLSQLIALCGLQYLLTSDCV